MGINTKTNEFLTALAKLVGESQLPACNARMALDLVRNQVAALERQAIEQEKAAEAAKETTDDKESEENK